MADDLTSLQSKLDEAEAAYHALMTGVREVEVKAGEYSVSYTQAKALDLKTYIAYLKQKIKALQGSPRRPMLVQF